MSRELVLLHAEDDEDMFVYLGRKIRKWLESLGHTLTHTNASNANRAVELLKRRSIMDGQWPTLVITDFNMPGGNGHILIDYLACVAPDTPVIFFSGGLCDEADRPHFNAVVKLCSMQDHMLYIPKSMKPGADCETMKEFILRHGLI